WELLEASESDLIQRLLERLDAQKPLSVGFNLHGSEFHCANNLNTSSVKLNLKKILRYKANIHTKLNIYP
ncbi:MAG: hypothetical protein AAFY50_02190, partial [Cyanobacteria bacterium J06648_1]